MPVTIIIQNAPAGANLLVNSERRPDHYRFIRNPERWGQHELTFATAEEFNAVSPDLLRAPGNPPMHVLVSPDEGAADPRLRTEVELLRGDLALARSEVARLGAELELARRMASLAGRKTGRGAEGSDV